MILSVPWKDSSVNQQKHGYAAICWGMNIMCGDGTNFLSKQLTTRAEAAQVILRAWEWFY